MVSTLSGLNFNLYRERLRRQKYSFISILTSCCRICPTCSFLTRIHFPTGSFKPSSVLCHSLLSAVARSHTHTSLTTALTCVHSHTLWPGWKGKLRLFVPPAADWTWVLWQEIGSWVFLHGSTQKVFVNSTSSWAAAGGNPQNCTSPAANTSNADVKQQKKLPGTDSHCLRKPITIWL